MMDRIERDPCLVGGVQQMMRQFGIGFAQIILVKDLDLLVVMGLTREFPLIFIIKRYSPFRNIGIADVV